MSGLTRVSPGASHRHQPLSGSVDFNQAAAFGEFLRSARERRGLSLQQIARETKIPERHLISLEHGDLSVIPGRTYRRGEVVAYATVVGLDRAVALAELERVSSAAVSGEAPTPTPSTTRRRHLGVGLLAMVAVIGSLTLVFGVWKPASTQVPQAPSPPLVNSLPLTTTSATTRATAQVTAAPTPSPPTPRSAVDGATASSRAAMASVQSELDPRLQVPRQEMVSSAVIPSRPNGVETSLVIISEPAGARVTVDGIGWGTTPVTIRNLPAGTRHIRVTKAGYTAAVRIARVPEQQRVTLTIPLQSASTGPNPR